MQRQSQRPKPPIKYHDQFIEVLDTASELTAFISGQTDWIWQYNAGPVRKSSDAAQ